MLFAAFAAAGCRGERPKAAEATPPAKVTGAVKEPELNAVTLTPETETRLGIQVVEVARKPVPNVRTIGGEAMVPPGQTIAVAAPVASPSVSTATAVKPGFLLSTRSP